MSTYIYGFRKASRNIVDRGEKATVQHLSYSYRLGNAWFTPSKYERVVNRTAVKAEKSFEDYDGGYVIIDDIKDGSYADLNGQKVYKNLKTPIWFDSVENEMEYVGYLVKQGRSYRLVHAVTEHEDDRAKVVAEYHPMTDEHNKEYIRYYFTNKQTGETESRYMHEEKELDYALGAKLGNLHRANTNILAHEVFKMVI